MSNNITNFNLSPFAKEILDDARQIAISAQHEFIMPEHFIIATADLCNLADDNNRFGDKFKNISIDLCKLLSEIVPPEDDSDPILSNLMIKV